VAQFYDPNTNTIFALSGVKGGASSLFSDPFARVRQELRRGTAAVLGEATIDGRKAYEIRLDEQTTGYFDESTYLPLRLDRSRGGAVVARSRVAVYQYLPATEANVRLLDLQNRHPGARLGAKPGPERPGKP